MASLAQVTMYEALQLRDQINAISKGFNSIGPVFGPISLSLPRLAPAELGFIRVVSWLFVQYFETGKLGTEFIGELASARNLENVNLIQQHRVRVQYLRTYCQHNLKPAEEHSQELQTCCEIWFKEHCGTHAPSDEAHWENILNALLDEAKDYFEFIQKVLRTIEKDDSFAQIIEQWELRISRFHAPFKFDEVILAVAADWGRDNIDAIKFRKRFYDKWRKEFEVRTDNCNFECEARKLVELAFLNEQENVLPISGTDVMETFDVPPGKDVGEILKMARELFKENPCNREDLLLQIKKMREIPIKPS